MVGVHCKCGKCNSNSRYPSKDYMQGVTFFPFPKPCQDHRLLKRDSTLQLRHDPNSCPQCCKCLVWINACRLQGLHGFFHKQRWSCVVYGLSMVNVLSRANPVASLSGSSPQCAQQSAWLGNCSSNSPRKRCGTLHRTVCAKMCWNISLATFERVAPGATTRLHYILCMPTAHCSATASSCKAFPKDGTAVF